MPSPDRGGRGTINFDYTTTLTETLTLTDSYTKVRGITLTESFFQLVDSVEVDYVAFEETLTLTDILENSITRAADTETVTLTDSRVLDVFKVLDAETATLTDSVELLPQLPLTETITIADTFDLTGRGRTDTLTLADSFDITAWGRSDALTLTDSVSWGWTFPDETITLTDSVTAFVLKLRQFTETVTLSDVARKTIYKTFTETLNLADTLIRLPNKITTETLNLADSLLAGNATEETETINLADTVELILTKVLVETLTIADALVKSISIPLTETLTLEDKRYLPLILTETLTLDDKYEFVPPYMDAILTLTDDIVFHITKVLVEAPVRGGGGLQDIWPYSMLNLGGGIAQEGGISLTDYFTSSFMTMEGKPFLVSVEMQPILSVVRETDPDIHAVQDRPQIFGVFGNIQIR